jgi:hypothetical protein
MGLMAMRRNILVIALVGGCGGEGGGAATTTDDGSSTAPVTTTGDVASTGTSSSSSSGETGTPPGTSSESGDEPPPVYFDIAVPEVDLGTMPTECPCADNTETIHVVTELGEIWRFDPTTLDFVLVVDVSTLPGCGFPSLFSMGVSRDGMAWLQYQDASLRTIDINAPAACTPQPFVPPVGLAGFNFGMGFVSESELHPCDSLYGIKDGLPGLLVEIDTAALVAANTYPTAVFHAELTGTGAGQLFAFVDGALIELDKDSGAELETTDLGGFQTTLAFAFAAYGGDFFFFTVSDVNPSSSKVTQLDYDDSDGNGLQDLVQILDTAPFNSRIVGAGVSTCAPTMPPPIG